MKQFKAESKKLMDLMINSIYTNKEIFLRELISNASDAIDKLYYRSLTDKKVKLDKDDFEINISFDLDKRQLIISDNGIGMTKEELEHNLGTIAHSGSFDFKENNKAKEDIDIIGQFGVGFYSAFMVADKVQVISKSFDCADSFIWESSGIEGYSIKKIDKESFGTDIILTIKDDEDYHKYLEESEIKRLIKKYSDYITYPIKMEINHHHKKKDSDDYEEVKKVETINSLIPIWKKDKKKIKKEDYNNFYKEKFFDYDDPIIHIHTIAEGTISYNSLIYIPSHASYDYYTKEYEKGLKLYSNGVLIMEKCGDLLPDYFSFIKGVVDTPDLSLNISRETLQQNRVLKTIAKGIENKIKKELLELLENDREKYIKFYDAFGMQLKIGIYSDFGVNKDKIQDLIMFYSSKKDEYVTLKEYCDNNSDSKEIYYACGESNDKIACLPQVESLKEKDIDVLYCSDYIDEFVLKTIMKYNDREFKNVCSDKLDINKQEEEEINKLNDKYKDMLSLMKDTIDVVDVKFTNKLSNHPVCLSTKGDISVEMEKVVNAMPTDQEVQAEKILEINEKHPIAKTVQNLYKKDKDKLKDYTKVLYAQARLIEGLPVDNPTEITNLICDIIAR